MALSIGIGCASLIWIAAAIGLVPDPALEQGRSRIGTARTLAVNVATYAENRRQVNLKKLLERTVESDDNIVSIGVRRTNSEQHLMTFGPHVEYWNLDHRNDAAKQISVEILASEQPWGELEIVFAPYQFSGNILWLSFPFGLVAFVFTASSLFAWVILSKSLKYLNPSNVVPSRVRSALDTLAEGLVLLDGNGEIAHANESFKKITSSIGEDILGRKIGDFGWQKEATELDEGMPWELCLEDQQRVARHVLSLTLPDSTLKKFAVNATPIYNGEEKVRGVLVSFDDVTALENKNSELAKIIGSLRSSRDEVARQNERLNFLASYDPLTKCMNRRSFFDQFEKYWNDEDCKLLNLLMLDIDFFKNINDTHGHSIGDEVLVLMGHLLRESVGDRGIVCRYGGEEFVVLIPSITVDQCESFANDLRQLIEQSETSGVKFTASLGLSCRQFIPMDAQHLLDQADESLYLAKGSGRNKVVRFDKRLEYKELIDKAAVAEAEQGKEIPYTAVTGLLSALSFRCPRTAEHSIRVADMSVIVGEQLMNRRELYQLEVAALLHDVGKIGVPDSILHKPGPLTKEEWVVMRKHDDIGAEIVRSALSSEKIAHYIESHHQEFSADDVGTDTVMLMPLASRIMTVCDAFDAMTNDRVYRPAMSEDEALQELERNSPGQFDPQVVSILCEHVRSGVHKPKSEVGRPVFSTQQANAIGEHIEELYVAVSDEDVEKIKNVVQQLRADASGDSQVDEVANRLDDAIGVTPQADLEEVLNLANEVMQICRESRNTFVQTAESIVAD
ncbi:diguanylate cyclase [Mariniblastus fucicola]|nr:diguanylate cyclase [Mariniblastus fucicola]